MDESGNTHFETGECFQCGGPLEHRPGEILDWWWCPKCRMAIECACETCQTFRALWLLGS